MLPIQVYIAPMDRRASRPIHTSSFHRHKRFRQLGRGKRLFDPCGLDRKEHMVLQRSGWYSNISDFMVRLGPGHPKTSGRYTRFHIRKMAEPGYGAIFFSIRRGNTFTICLLCKL